MQVKVMEKFPFKSLPTISLMPKLFYTERMIYNENVTPIMTRYVLESL